MKVVYSPRAIRDLEEIGAYYRAAASPKIAAAIGERIERVINRLPHHPHAAPRVARRANVRAVLVLRYPFKIFYRVRGDDIEILHIRHTARRPWIRDDERP
jgi:plasmid stabilization system protein ParE